MIQVKSYKELTELKNIEEKTIAAVEITEGKFKMFTYVNGEWKPQTGKTGLGMSYYDMNKQMISQMKEVIDLSNQALQEKLAKYFYDNSDYKYFMLLCNDLRYYTLFHRDCQHNTENPVDALIDVLANSIFGTLKSIEIVEDKNLEIWFIDHDNEVRVSYLFPYDQGVIECQ